jgi:pimeloyl-ACP methyl ester carboxylesterase
MKHSLTICLLLLCNLLFAQTDSVLVLNLPNDVIATVDYPRNFSAKQNTQLVFFALPNGNTTAQTMGKKMEAGDDWHFGIQHIAAQTRFVREKITNENMVVVYLENKLKAWPSWKRSHADYEQLIPAMMDTVVKTLSLKKYSIHLNGHSGGGSFIFGYIQSQQQIPRNVRRITFMDSNYGYDSSFTKKMMDWVKSSSSHMLTVFAYNDSIALYNGKPVVSATGGTWYRSKLMMKDMSTEFDFNAVMEDSVQHFFAFNRQVNVFLVDNPERKILHTKQVELNGFIHSILLNTKFESEGYQYFRERAYNRFIQ